MVAHRDLETEVHGTGYIIEEVVADADVGEAAGGVPKGRARLRLTGGNAQQHDYQADNATERCMMTSRHAMNNPILLYNWDNITSFFWLGQHISRISIHNNINWRNRPSYFGMHAKTVAKLI